MSNYTSTAKKINNVLNKNIFFVVGTMKSGTTWLQMILDSHPDISCRGEGHFTDILAPNLVKSIEDYNSRIGGIYNNKIFNEMPDYPSLQKEHYLFLLQSSICLLFHDQMNGRKVKAIGEKTPNHTRAMFFLLELFPRAKFIHIIRDGRDTAVSAWYHFQRINPKAIKNDTEAFSKFVEQFAEQWVADINEAHTFGKQHPDKYREYHYESLSSKGKPVIKDMLKFLKIDSSNNLVKDCLEQASFNKLSKGRKQGDENKNSHFRKGIVGDWRNHFSTEDTIRFNRIAGTLLERFNYIL